MARCEFPIVIPRDSTWRSDHVLVIEVENRADYMVNLLVTFFGEQNEVQVRLGLFPHWLTKVPVPLAIADGRTLFPERTPGRFKAMVRGANLGFDELERIEIATAEGAEKDVELRNAEIESDMPEEFPMPSEPLVDGLHQWRGRDWPGKASSLDELRGVLEGELEETEPPFPEEWSKYGGWKGKTFAATGYFRTEHDGRRWWLVDPDGCAFWSMGIDCVRIGSGVNVTGIESVFESPLPDEKEAPHLWSGHGRSRIFNGMAHNLERALGADWEQKWLELTRRRLRRYRVNTIGNWSDRRLHSYCDIPYVFTMGSFPGTKTPIFRDFPDVYSSEFEANSREFAQQLSEIRDDPNVIGYFMTNEPLWAFVDGFDVGAQLLMGDEPFASLSAFIDMLKEKYGTVEALNAAWGSDFDSFDDLKGKQDPRRFPGSEEDTLAFTREAVERYVRIPAAACRAIDPNHLNLGLRWAWIHSDYQLAGAEVLDAFSINCYQLKPDSEQIAAIVERTGKPMMIGEFHVGSLERGLPSGGIRNTWTMAESVEAYRYYVENAVAIPGLIGAHYFQWNDQHVMGRFDGENMQIGWHDITCRPYDEWVETCREVHPSLYRIADGQVEPSAKESMSVPQGTLVW